MGHAGLFGVGQTTAKALLEAQGCDMSKLRTTLVERWFDGGKAAILAEIGDVEAVNPALEGETLECQVCYESCEARDITGNRCGHFFCNECWAMHIQMQVTDAVADIQCSETCPFLS